ncbi:hypothetical protein [Petroclostridium xylanilyticum]|uniref:hypothetical protein n=1 Tax=Petroclostridium xylanilyticum TaxID=1792311 RepID=UPI0012FFBAD0|nr:hypothetical protein [Petroclostridium xylanilyticum]
MIELKKDNVHKIVASKEKAEALMKKGFELVENPEKETKRGSVKRGEPADN